MMASNPSPVDDLSRSDRFKTWLIETALPTINLTSYRNLLRARAAADRLADENANIQQRLQTLTAAHEQLGTAHEQLGTAHEQLERRYGELKEQFQQLHESAKSDQEKVPFVLAQAAQIRALLHDPRETREAMRVLETYFRNEHDDQAVMNLLRGVYQASLDENTAYWDIRKTVRVAATVLHPKTYLEIGTRSGWSLAQYFAIQPHGKAYVFDLWIADYAGVLQGSPESVLDKMKEVVGGKHTPEIEFISGNSHDTLNDCFNGLIPLQFGSCPAEFDLIVVDGDHTNTGAWWDLYDTFPRVKVGGAIIFDDLDSTGIDEMTYTVSSYQRPPLPEGVSGLRNVWLHMQALHPNFVFIDCYSYRFPCGIGIRLF